MRDIIKNNITISSVFVFVIIFYIIYKIKPNCVFDKDGMPKMFGIGYENKTITPLWILVIIISVISYLLVLYYLAFPNI